MQFYVMTRTLESKSLKIYVSKTDTMLCSKNDEPLKVVDDKGYTLNQVETVKYLDCM